MGLVKIVFPMAIKKILKQSGSFLFVKFLNDTSLFTQIKYNYGNHLAVL